MAAIRKIKRVGKRAFKFQYSATYQSAVIECQAERWTPHMISVAFHRKGRRIVSKILPWLPSPDNKIRGVVVWPEPETVEAAITLYKGQKDKSYENKEWDFSVINVDRDGHRKVLATTSVNLIHYASALPFEHELQLKLKPVSCKIKKILLELSLSSVLLKEGKATDDDMISLASMMSISNLSTIGNLEDEEDDYTIPGWSTGRSISPDTMNEAVPSTDKLIDWAQEVTAGYSGVKINDMTSSWKNGLAFCAIIHYYRPDLLDYNQLSHQGIKENNRLAFNIAKELGIACPLTPNMMLLCDIPDKLAVTSFVYQMYNYFTRAVHSAITKPNIGMKETSPSSPMGFDLSKFEQFSINLTSTSPEGTLSSSRSLIGNPYSRHSLKEETSDVSHQDTPPNNQTTPPSHVTTSDVSIQDINEDDHSRDQSIQETSPSNQPTQDTPPSNNSSDSPPIHSTPNKPPDDNEIQGLVDDHTGQGLIEGRGTKEVGTIPWNDLSPLGNQEKKMDTSTYDKSYSSVVTTDETSSNSSSGNSSPEEPQTRRSSVPTLTSQSSPQLDEKKKKDYYRKKARDMIKSAGISNVDITTYHAISDSTRKRLQEARQLQVNEISSHDLCNTKSDTALPVNKAAFSTEESPNNTSQLAPAASETKVTTPESDIPNTLSTISSNQEANESGTKSLKSTIKSAPTSLNNKQQKFSKSYSSDQSSKVKEKRQRSSSNSLVISAPSSRPSSASKQMARKPPQRVVSETDGNDKKSEEDNEKNKQTSEVETQKMGVANEGVVEDVRPVSVPMNVSQDSVSSLTMDSPSAWSAHENDLHEDILVSQSDYVKSELMILHKQLKPLEERAGVIEKEIREAMAKGDTNKEELLTVEYFKLLNEKNVLIKKQIELNLLEKEEDLEKRQFFINRELRPLAAIPEDQKTEDQKTREQQLIQELLELVNEREWLDQRLTNTTHSSIADSTVEHQETPEHEGHSFSFSTSSKFRLNKDRSSSQTKDCVIS